MRAQSSECFRRFTHVAMHLELGLLANCCDCFVVFYFHCAAGGGRKSNCGFQFDANLKSIQSNRICVAGVRAPRIPLLSVAVRAWATTKWYRLMFSFIFSLLSNIRNSNNKTNTEFNMMVRVMFQTSMGSGHERHIHLWIERNNIIILPLNSRIEFLACCPCPSYAGVCRVSCQRQSGWEFYFKYQSFHSIHDELQCIRVTTTSWVPWTIWFVAVVVRRQFLGNPTTTEELWKTNLFIRLYSETINGVPWSERGWYIFHFRIKFDFSVLINSCEKNGISFQSKTIRSAPI